MGAIDRYIQRQLVVGLIFVACGLCAILWLTQSLRFIELAVDRGASLLQFLELTLLVLPNLLTVVLPVALFTVVLFIYNRLASDRELVVLRAAGLSDWRLARPALVVGSALGVVCLGLNLWLIPLSVARFHELQWGIRSNAVNVLLQDGAFNEISPGLTIYMRSHSSDGSLEGLMVDDERTPGRKVTMMAANGRLIIDPDGADEVAMVDGVRQEVVAGSDRMSVLYFDTYTMKFTTSMAEAETESTDPRQQSMTALLAAEPATVGDSLYRQYRVEAHQRLASPLYNLAFALLASACLLAGRFSRRGQADRLALAVAAMLVVQALALGVSDLATRNLALVPLIYIGPLLPALAAGWMLLRPGLRAGPATRLPAY